MTLSYLNILGLDPTTTPEPGELWSLLTVTH